YRFTIYLVKADDTECPPRHIDFEVFPEPEEPPIDPPIDPPVTNPDPCFCPTVTAARIEKDCYNTMYLVLEIDYPALQPPCQLKLSRRNNGVLNTHVTYTITNLTNVISLPISNPTNLQYQLSMFCCTDGQTTSCTGWVDVPTIDDICECVSAPTVTVVNHTVTGDNTVQILINITGSNPSITPYSVNFSATNGYSQNFTFNSAGQHLLTINNAFTEATITVSNKCGSDSVTVNQSWCKNAPFIQSVIPDNVNDEVTITFYSEANGSALVELYAAGSYPTVLFSQNVTLTGSFSYSVTMNVDSSLWSLDFFVARVTDGCGFGEKNSIG